MRSSEVTVTYLFIQVVKRHIMIENMKEPNWDYTVHLKT